MTVTQLYPSAHAQLPDGHINGQQLAARAGVPYRTIDYYTRVGYLHVVGNTRPGSGYQRLYPTSEAAVAHLIGRLRDAGLTPKAAHDHARLLLEYGRTDIAGITLHLPQEL